MPLAWLNLLAIAALTTAEITTTGAYGEPRQLPQSGEAAQVQPLLAAVTRACGSIPLRSTDTNAEAGIAGTGALNKLLKALADVGLTLNFKIVHEQSSGFPKEQLAQAFGARETCIPATLKILARMADVRSVETGKQIPATLIIRTASSREAVLARLTVERDVSQAGSNNTQTVIQGNGNYITAPVTPDQKVQAVAELVAHLEDLAQYPSTKSASEPSTIFEKRSLLSPALNLYSLLRTYNRETISSLPRGARELLVFEREYYVFQANEILLENALGVEVGKSLKSPSFAWAGVEEYCITRSMSSGLTAQNAAEKGWSFLGPTVEQAEAACVALNNTSYGKLMASQTAQHAELEKMAATILSAYE